MTPASTYASPVSGGWFSRTADWLDARGKPAWIAATIIGFIAFWPVGLAILAYAIWSKRMFSGTKMMSCNARRMAPTRFRSTGNMAFDSYKADMLKRLEDEQDAFESFLDRLREAKDKTEFDQFMDERSKRGGDTPAEA